MEIRIDDNIILNYNKEGNGSPLILLHGNGEDLHIFDKLTKQLKQHFTVYAIDSRNHGNSSKTDEFSYESMLSDLDNFINKLDLKKVSIVGFSDGAILALLLAIENPALLNKMALLGINLKPDDFKKDIYQYLVEEYEKTNDPLVKMMLEQPNIELRQLKKVKTPTLIVCAEDDLFELESFQNISHELQNSSLLIMKGQDHGSYIVDQDLLYPNLLEFFE